MTIAEYIENCSYTDFIGLINQTNVPPGSYSTLTKWVAFSGLNSTSNVLEIACTSGFSLREISKQTGCRGLGIDISAASIQRAKENFRLEKLENQIKYEVADAYKIQKSEPYTHIILGAAAGFFDDERKLILKCTEQLGEKGYILASPFYVTSPIPQDLLERTKSILGIYPTNRTYKEVLSAYQGLKVFYEDRNSIFKETEAELEHYCESTARRAIEQSAELSPLNYDSLFKRLYEIKAICNDLRPYQNYATIIFHYDSREFPNRYVELF